MSIYSYSWYIKQFFTVASTVPFDWWQGGLLLDHFNPYHFELFCKSDIYVVWNYVPESVWIVSGIPYLEKQDLHFSITSYGIRFISVKISKYLEHRSVNVMNYLLFTLNKSTEIVCQGLSRGSLGLLACSLQTPHHFNYFFICVDLPGHQRQVLAHSRLVVVPKCPL